MEGDRKNHKKNKARMKLALSKTLHTAIRVGLIGSELVLVVNECKGTKLGYKSDASPLVFATA